MVAQAAIHEGLALDPRPLLQDGLAAAEVDVGRGEVAQALVSPEMIDVPDEGGHTRLQFAGQVGVFEEDAVLERLVPALDLALGLGMTRRAADGCHPAAAEPVGQIGRDVARPVVGQQPRAMHDLPLIEASGGQRQVERGGDVTGLHRRAQPPRHDGA